MSDMVDKLTADCQPRPKPDPRREPNPAVDRIFRSYGGKPENVDNWQAIALCFVELGIFLITPELKAKHDGSEQTK